AVPDDRSLLYGARQYGAAILGCDLPRLQRLAARFLPVQPGPAENVGDAAGARCQPCLRRALSLRQGIRRGRRLCQAQLRQRSLLALQLLGPALQPLTGAGCAVVLSRGHRLLLFDDRASLWREPLYAPCREPLDRDAIGADRADARWRPGVLPEIAGCLSGGAELVGAGAVGPHRMGFAAAPPGRRALSQADALRVLAAQLLLRDRKRRARGRLGCRAIGRRRQYLRVERLSAFRLELPGGIEPGAKQFQHRPRYCRQDPVGRRAPLRLQRR